MPCMARSLPVDGLFHHRLFLIYLIANISCVVDNRWLKKQVLLFATELANLSDNCLLFHGRGHCVHLRKDAFQIVLNRVRCIDIVTTDDTASVDKALRQVALIVDCGYRRQVLRIQVYENLTVSRLKTRSIRLCCARIWISFAQENMKVRSAAKYLTSKHVFTLMPQILTFVTSRCDELRVDWMQVDWHGLQTYLVWRF